MLAFSGGTPIMEVCVTYHFACEVNFGHGVIDLELCVG